MVCCDQLQRCVQLPRKALIRKCGPRGPLPARVLPFVNIRKSRSFKKVLKVDNSKTRWIEVLTVLVCLLVGDNRIRSESVIHRMRYLPLAFFSGLAVCLSLCSHSHSAYQTHDFETSCLAVKEAVAANVNCILNYHKNHHRSVART